MFSTHPFYALPKIFFIIVLGQHLFLWRHPAGDGPVVIGPETPAPRLQVTRPRVQDADWQRDRPLRADDGRLIKKIQDAHL